MEKFKIEKHEVQMKSLISNLRKKKVFQTKNKRIKPKLDPEQLLFSTRIENINNSNYQFEKLKLAEMTCMCLSLSGIGCSVLAGNLAASVEDSNENLNFLPIPLVLGSIITFVLLFGIYWRAQKELKWEQSKLIYSNEDDLTTTKKIRTVALELLLNMIHPVYSMQYIKVQSYVSTLNATISYNLCSIISLIMMLRIYHLIRFVSSISKYRTARCQRLCRIYGSQPTHWFGIKCLMREDPVRFIAWMFVFGTFMASYALWVFESPTFEYGAKDFRNFGNAIWCIIVTMATVGYGDYYPVTDFGRITAVCACIWGVLTISLTAVTFSNLLTLNLGEATSLAVLQRLWSKEDIKKQAALVLTSSVRYTLLIKRSPENWKEINKQYRLFRNHLIKFQALRFQHKNLYDFDSFYDRIDMKSLEIIDIYNQALEYNKKSQEIIKFFNEENKI